MRYFYVHKRHLLTAGAVIGLLCSVLLALFASSAAATERVAVIGFESGEKPVPQQWLDAWRGALEQDPDVAIMSEAEMRGVLGVGAIPNSGGKARTLLSKLQDGIDAYFEDDRETAERLLSEGLNDALTQPIILLVDDTLATQAPKALIVLARVYRDLYTNLDAADETVDRLVRTFPRWKPPTSQTPPAFVEKIESSRTRLARQGKELFLDPVSQTRGCDIKLNGTPISVDSEEVVTVWTAGYGLMLECGDVELGPFVLTIKHSRTTLPLSPEILESVEPAVTGGTMSLPASYSTRRDVGVLLTTLLDLDAVYMLAQSEDDAITVAHIKRDGSATIARVEEGVQPDPEVIELSRRVVQTGEPAGPIAVDTDGLGFVHVEEPTYIIEYVALGTGAAAVIAGGVLLALADGKVSEIRACQEIDACDSATVRAHNASYVDNLFTGKLMLGIGSAIMLGAGTSLLVRMLSADAASDAVATRDGWNLVPTHAGALGTWTIEW